MGSEAKTAPPAVKEPCFSRVVLLARLERGPARGDGDRDFPGVIIREGVYVPGIGNPKGERIHFSREFLARIAPTGEGKRVDLDHSDAKEDEVGFMHDLAMDEANLRAVLTVQQARPRFADAVAFVDGRLALGKVPNVSIELENIVTRPAKTAAEKAMWDHDAIDATLEGVAILPEGACSDKAGCGIGLAAEKAGFTVLALQGIDNKEDEQPMCDQKDLVASLQADKKALEERLKEKDTALTAVTKERDEEKAAKASLTKERDTLKATADAREKEDREDLTAALKEALPDGTDLESIVGKEPTVQALSVALKTIGAQPKPRTPQGGAPAAGGQRLGRHTAANPRSGDNAAPTADRTARVLALRKRVGLPEKSPLPAKMQRNSDARLLAQEGDIPE